MRAEPHTVDSRALRITQSYADENHRVRSWQTITFGAILLSLLVLAALAWTRLDFSGQEIPDWKPVLALADAAREKNELYKARNLYSQARRLAAQHDDWAGLLASACGMKILEKEKGPRSSTNALLLRAMVAAENWESRSGMAAVANAFSVLGEDKVASMVLSRIGKNWLKEPNDSASVPLPSCWPK
jgi:hypothetical protein